MVRFSDVTDRNTIMAVESLRLMGVLDGYNDNTFRPGAALNRAQFCKMAVYAMNGEEELGLYNTVTIFPDAKPTHWASAYINMASRKGIIAGYPDGRFHPERTVTVGQAVTILLRMLGYEDKDIGGVWPASYMAVGATVGLTDGIGTNGNATLTRGQAAQLFLNLLRADMKEKGSYLSSLKATVLENQVLVTSSARGSDGLETAMKLASGDAVYQMASGKASNGALNGLRGTLVLNKSGKVITFVPDAMGVQMTITVASTKASQIVDVSGATYTVTGQAKTYYNGEEKPWSEVFSWVSAGSTVTLYLNAAGGADYIFVGGGSEANSLSTKTAPPPGLRISPAAVRIISSIRTERRSWPGISRSTTWPPTPPLPTPSGCATPASPASTRAALPAPMTLRRSLCWATPSRCWPRPGRASPNSSPATS